MTQQGKRQASARAGSLFPTATNYNEDLQRLSTTMVPALGVEGVARIIEEHVFGVLHGTKEAARAIIAAMEKNDG
jgi:hypothetical protein